MFRQIILKQDKTNPDPLTAGNNGVGRKPLGTYKQEKAAAMAKAGETSYTRKDYRDAVKANIQERRDLGQQVSRVDDFMNRYNFDTGVGGIASAASSLVQSAFVDHDETKNTTGYEGQQKVGNFLMKSGNPVLMAAGLAWNTLSTVAENTNGNVHKITDQNIKDLGLSKFGAKANNIFSNIPGIGWAIEDTSETRKSHLIDEMSNAYADSVEDIDNVSMLGDSNFLFNRKKIEGKIQDANRKNELMTNINLTNTQRKQSDYGMDLAQQNLNRYMGTNYMNMRMGKSGMKLTELDHFKALLRNRIVEETPDVQKFAEGGSILPTGKLHKELHHLDDMGEQFEDLTRKGIPVVTMDEGGEMVQVAEIERDEWTWSKEFTDQIEALWKEGSEESMIETGKLVCEELLRNTQDEGGLLNGDN